MTRLAFTFIKQIAFEAQFHDLVVDLDDPNILFSHCFIPGVTTNPDFGETSQHCAWNTHLEEDLKLCIQLFPDSLNSTFGRIRYLDGLTPLYAACLNETVPVSVIEILLQAGAEFVCQKGSPSCAVG